MNLAIESDRCVDFCRGDAAVVERVRRASSIGVPLVGSRSFARDFGQVDEPRRTRWG